MIAVIPHDEQMIVGHENGLISAFDPLVRRICAVLRIDAVSVFIERAIDVDFLIVNFQAISREPNHSLDIVLAPVVGIYENDHVIPLGRADRDYIFSYVRDLYPIDEVIDQNVITHK